MKIYPGGRESRQGRTGVVIMGWLGSTPRRLRRHAELFSLSLGVDTLATIPSMTSAVIPFVARKTARSIEKELTEGIFADKERIVFLNMSGNGDNTFSHLLIQQNKKVRKENNDGKPKYGPIAMRTSGVIYDSAPVPQTSWLWSQALTAAVVSNLPFRKGGSPARYNVPVFTRAVRMCSDAHLSLMWNKQWKARLYNASFSCLPLQTRMMFAYSQNDYLVPACYVEDYAAKHRAAGRDVVKWDFGDSAHVDHFRRYPSKYLSATKAFLSSVSMI